MKKILILILIVIFGFAIYAYYQYNRPPENVVDRTPYLETEGTELIEKFSENRGKISEELAGKVVSIRGKITDIEKGNSSAILILDQGIKCEIAAENMTEVQVEDRVKILGFYSGYDEMFNEISFTRCVVKVE